MQLEEGMILEGKVSGLSSFGAFVELPGGQSGLVHISEISSEYVEDINDFLKKGQTVKVKVVALNSNGKISLSIRKAEPQKPKKSFESKKPTSGPGNYEWTKQKKATESNSFETMMSKFKQSSDEKIASLKKNDNSPHRPRRNNKPRT